MYRYTSDFDEKHDSDIDEMSHFLLLLKAFFMDSFSVEFNILGSEKIDTFFCRIKKKCRKKCRKKKVLKSESDVTLEITPPFIIGFFTLESSYSVQCFSVYYAKISPFRGDFA